jgi:Fanconi anemia group M protein
MKKKPSQKIIKPEKAVIFVDNREFQSDVAQHLKDFDVIVKTKQLDVGDYITSDRVCIERKRVGDFLQSIADQRIFRQIEELSMCYNNPLLIIEGDPQMLFSERSIHENAIRGVLSSIAIDYHIPIIWTQDSKETAAQISWIAKREQILDKRDIQIRANKKTPDLRAQQEFLVAGLPGISSTLSRRLLEHFKAPIELFNADINELIKINKIGKKKAAKIRKIIDSRYFGGAEHG